MNASNAEARRPEQVFFDDPAIDRLLAMFMTLATDHYVLRDRVRALETQLEREGHLDGDTLRRAPSDAEHAAGAKDAADFVRELLQPLLAEQQAAGVSGMFSLKNGKRRGA